MSKDLNDTIKSIMPMLDGISENIAKIKSQLGVDHTKQPDINSAESTVYKFRIGDAVKSKDNNLMGTVVFRKDHKYTDSNENEYLVVGFMPERKEFWFTESELKLANEL
jgi:hypothetical protein